MGLAYIRDKSFRGFDATIAPRFILQHLVNAQFFSSYCISMHSLSMRSTYTIYQYAQLPYCIIMSSLSMRSTCTLYQYAQFPYCINMSSFAQHDLSVGQIFFSSSYCISTNTQFSSECPTGTMPSLSHHTASLIRFSPHTASLIPSFLLILHH